MTPANTLMKGHTDSLAAQQAADLHRRMMLRARADGGGAGEAAGAALDITPETPGGEGASHVGGDGVLRWGWEEWISDVLPGPFGSRLGARHVRLWKHVDPLELGGYVAPRIEIWPRGSGKTTTAEALAAFLGTTGRRRFCLYVRETQKQANASVQAIGEKLLSPGVERAFPRHAERAVNKYGISKGFSTNLLRTAGGFNAVALGMDAAGRGLKLDDYRPDVIIIDDIDGRHDSPAATKKKIETLTDTILPMGGSDTVVIFIQNLIIPNGVASQLVDGRADFLQDRVVSGPHPAVKGLEWAWEDRKVKDAEGRVQVRRVARITGGVATWEGQDLAACQRRITQYGITAFLRECQHKVQDVEGALWSSGLLNANRVSAHGGPGVSAPSSFRYIAVGVDPSGTRKGSGDATGIVVEGLGYDGVIYTLDDRSIKGAPDVWARAVIEAAVDWDADAVVAESNFGGEMVRSVIGTAQRAMRRERPEIPLIPVFLEHASRGKVVRAEPVAQLMPEGLNKLVGGFSQLEDELTTWVQGDTNSPNRLDAKVWASTFLLKKSKKAGRKRKRVTSSVYSTAS